MILQIFTIHDKKAEAYLPPFYLPQTNMALRTFGDCINDDKHTFSLHPQDYTLMSIGSFDDTTAIAITIPPESLGNGLQFILNEPDPDQMELIPGAEKPTNSAGKII